MFLVVNYGTCYIIMNTFRCIGMCVNLGIISKGGVMRDKLHAMFVTSHMHSANTCTHDLLLARASDVLVAPRFI